MVSVRYASLATKVSFSTEETMQFPSLLVCPTRWISRQRVRELNMSSGSLAWLGGLLDGGLGLPGAAWDDDAEEVASARAWRNEWPALKATTVPMPYSQPDGGESLPGEARLDESVAADGESLAGLLRSFAGLRLLP